MKSRCFYLVLNSLDKQQFGLEQINHHCHEHLLKDHLLSSWVWLQDFPHCNCLSMDIAMDDPFVRSAFLFCGVEMMVVGLIAFLCRQFSITDQVLIRTVIYRV